MLQLSQEGHIARDYWNPRKHSEENVSTTKEAILSGCLSEEELDANATTAIEDDGDYFVENLAESETPSTDIFW